MSVALTAAIIARAARSPGASAFPFLKPFSKKVAPGCCGKVQRGPNVQSAITAVGRLPPDRLRAFKALVGADKLSLWVVRAARVVKVEI